MKEKQKIVTVFVTVYNVAAFLPRFFESVAAQTFDDYNLLIFDDGSEDNTLELCERQAAVDERIRVVHSEHIGISAARNRVLRMIDTPFTVSMDADDIYSPDYLLHLVEAQNSTGADLVISRVICQNETGRILFSNPPRGRTVLEKKDFREALPALLNENRLNYLYAKLYRTEYLRECRVEDDVKMGSDTMFNFQYLLKIQSIALIDDDDTIYIKYDTRAVCSYKGTDLYVRQFRIERIITEVLQGSDYWSDDMQRAIDRRVFLYTRSTILSCVNAGIDLLEQYNCAREMADTMLYQEAWARHQASSQEYRGPLLKPGNEIDFVNQVNGLCLIPEKDLKALENEVHRLSHSNSWRIGRLITFPVRVMKQVWQNIGSVFF